MNLKFIIPDIFPKCPLWSIPPKHLSFSLIFSVVVMLIPLKARCIVLLTIEFLKQNAGTVGVRLRLYRP